MMNQDEIVIFDNLLLRIAPALIKRGFVNGASEAEITDQIIDQIKIIIKERKKLIN